MKLWEGVPTNNGNLEKKFIYPDGIPISGDERHEHGDSVSALVPEGDGDDGSEAGAMVGGADLRYQLFVCLCDGSDLGEPGG